MEDVRTIALVMHLMAICAIIATFSLVIIARSLYKLVGKFDDLKRELEEMKQKLNQ